VTLKLFTLVIKIIREESQQVTKLESRGIQVPFV